ncbi:MAG: hypothetical protein H6971_05060 [Gammaproteobacteria bacterium]|nr:hypothetical protein [Gammaproteobacteria bacterium]
MPFSRNSEGQDGASIEDLGNEEDNSCHAFPAFASFSELQLRTRPPESRNALLCGSSQNL